MNKKKKKKPSADYEPMVLSLFTFHDRGPSCTIRRLVRSKFWGEGERTGGGGGRAAFTLISSTAENAGEQTSLRDFLGGEINAPLTRGLSGCPSALKRRGPIFSDSPPAAGTTDREEES